MKRSRYVALAAMGAGAFFLSACGEEKVEVGVYETIEQCAADSGNSLVACEQALAQAKARHAEEAPRFANREVCEAEFGAGRCETAPTQAGTGGSFFMPLMMGYMMGNLMRGGAAAQPLYRTADAGAFRTADNQTVARTTGRTQVASRVAQGPARGATVARSGFGGGAVRSFGS